MEVCRAKSVDAIFRRFDPLAGDWLDQYPDRSAWMCGVFRLGFNSILPAGAVSGCALYNDNTEMRICIPNVRRTRHRNLKCLAPPSGSGYPGLLVWILLPTCALAQPQTLTWEQVKARFQAENPTLRAGELNISEAKAAEITAHLRPNPTFGATVDQITPFPSPSAPWRPLTNALPVFDISYLHERQRKRELRTEAAKEGTVVAISQQADLIRTLTYQLRNAFVQVLQAKAVHQNAEENLKYWDHELDISRERLKAGDIAHIDLIRLELQRAQFQSDLENSMVSLRTAKIQLLQLLNDRTPVDQFDVNGPFDFAPQINTLEELRNTAVAARPDLAAAVQNVTLAKTNHSLAVANGSTDPTWDVDFAAQNPPIPFYFGVNINIPLRIFDRNQGEKLRTELDITKNERTKEAALAQVYSDVDSAYTAIQGALNLLKPYKEKYLSEAAEVRDTVEFSYRQGGNTLLDYLDAEKSYRDVRLAYINLVGNYLTAAAQMNMAAGREVIQ
jgi:cobalt-zinc-cadmium efflux system outer membrane protein